MILISHRGNISGPNPERENHPDYILEALKAGYEVEIDVWFVDGKFKLGHDNPQYDFPFELINEHHSKIWIHCKNTAALEILLDLDPVGAKVNYFWHEQDTVALTSKNNIWAYPGKQPIKHSIAVLPELNETEDLSLCIGICSDHIEKYKA
jgi:hypothetical protein